MSVFINRVKRNTSRKEILIKNTITTQLSESVKEIQLGNMGGDISGESFDVNNPVLCNVIESLFLHGLKNSLMSQARRVFADVDQRPEPSFWAPVLLISHKQIINQIGNLSQISTETGQCRAWIRIALNDSLLSSYLFAIQQNFSAMKSYYNSYAYIRDPELMDVAQKLIEGLESSTTFTFPINSSLLNVWPPESLILAGIWCPTLRSCPVASGVDIAQSIQTAKAINSETCSLDSVVSSVSSGLGQMLNEDEALKIILSKHTSESKKHDKGHRDTTSNKKIESQTSQDDVYPEPSQTLGNSLNKRLGWSFSKEDQEEENNLADNENDSTVQTPDVSNRPKSMETSYNALIESYNITTGANGRIPDLNDVISADEKIDEEKVIPEKDQNLISDNQLPFIDEWKSIYLKIGTIAMEKGLDSQNFECKSCKVYLGLGAKWGTCGFSGYYYCESCMSETDMCIPARIVHNWDFKKYPVSQQAVEYVNEIKELPTINMKTLNPLIYSAVEEMAKLQKLRVQLNYLRDYLFTCHEPIIEQLRSRLGAREYMYEHIHQYSILDLLEIYNGALAQCIQEVVDFGKQHVLSCWLCSQKGFICEVCNDSKILYPFDIDRVYRCSGCNAVYHKTCLNKGKPCPKCERRKKRIDLILLSASVD